MLVELNTEHVKKELEKGKLERIVTSNDSFVEDILDVMIDNKNHEMFKEAFKDYRKHKDVIPLEKIMLLSVSAKMKQNTSVTDIPYAITSPELLAKIGHNIIEDEKDAGLMSEGVIREIVSRYHACELIFGYNKYADAIIDKYSYRNQIKRHILDCTHVTVNYSNYNYEYAEITKEKGTPEKGYKLATIRGITETGGIIEEIRFAPINMHDMGLSREMILSSKHLKAGDILLEDRGFIDIESFRELSSKGITVIIPAKQNMDIYKVAVETAIDKNEWTKHPNEKRKGQNIAIVPNMEEYWIPEDEKVKKPENARKMGYGINCCVIRFDVNKNKEILEDKGEGNIAVIGKNKKYAYAVIISNDRKMSASQIIRAYEQRPEIEEDYRQLKDFWKLEDFKSTKYIMILFHIVMTLIGYLYYQIYKDMEEGEEYIGKSLPVILKNYKQKSKNQRFIIYVDKYYGIFNFSDIFEIYGNAKQKIKEKIMPKIKEYIS